MILTKSPSLNISNTNSSSIWPHHALLMVMTVVWGSNFILAEVALLQMSPIAFSVSRFSAGVLVLLSLQYYRTIRLEGSTFIPTVEKQDWPRLLLVAGLGAALAPWLGIEGLSITHGGRAALWLALAPACSAGFGILLNTESIGTNGKWGLLLAGFGTIGMAIDGLSQPGYWLGDLMLLGAIMVSVIELHLIKPLSLKYGATPIVSTRTFLGVLIYLLIASPALIQTEWAGLGLWTWIAILAGGTIGIGIGQWAKVRALCKIGPTRVVLYGNLVPVVTLGIAWIFLSKAPEITEVLAGGLILIGAWLLQNDRRQ